MFWNLCLLSRLHKQSVWIITLNTNIYVVDTNVLLEDPLSIYSFPNSEIIIPIKVIEEIDTFKKDRSDLGFNSRRIARELDELRTQGSLQLGVKTSNDSIIRILINQNDNSVDNDIIEIAKQFKAIVISKDINVRLKADANGVKSQDYHLINDDDICPQYLEIQVDANDYNIFFDDGLINNQDYTLFPNQYIMLRNGEGLGSVTALARYDHIHNKIVPLNFLQIESNHRNKIWGIYPKNREQQFLFDALLNPTIQLVTILGAAGTGKTLISLAAGLHLTLDKKTFDKITVTRPIIPVGRDIGFLPGSKDEKLSTWMQPIFDNMSILFDEGSNGINEKITYLIQTNKFEMEALTYIRGRTIAKQFFLIDEAQNLTVHEIKTILSRVGKDTKVVITGDPYQIDNPNLDRRSNGLVYLIKKFKDYGIAANINLYRTERSELAGLAAQIL